jgi:hypothetical protein
MMAGTDISKFPIHLGLGATAVVEPGFSGMEWYEAYLARHSSDGAEGRLVSMFSFSESWDSWEMHPSGAEVVICTAGKITLLQEKLDGTKASVTLESGQFAINEPGTWHTADVENQATAIFITAGLGTQVRPR